MARVNVARTDFPWMKNKAKPPHEVAATWNMPSPRDALARVVGTCLLGERQFYMDGQDIEKVIVDLCAKVAPVDIADEIIRARAGLGLRHAPLLLALQLLNSKEGKPYLRHVAPTLLRTPRDALDLVAMFWKDGKRPLPFVLKRALAAKFAEWSPYQLRKYATLGRTGRVAVRLRDVMRLVHPNAKDAVSVAAPCEGSIDFSLIADYMSKIAERNMLYKEIADDTVSAPETWEAMLSVPGADKRAAWVKLLSENKLGALALVRNLRNMEAVGVPTPLVVEAMDQAKAADVWPWQALAAAREAPAYAHALDNLMIRSAGSLPRIPGKTAVLVDVSGSMDAPMSERGTMKRLDAGAGLAVVLREVCEAFNVASFSDNVVAINHPMSRGVTLAKTILESQSHGGTRLASAISAALNHYAGLDRLVIITDEQSQESIMSAAGVPIYVINIASTERGVNFQQSVTRINGWSGAVVRWLALEIAGAEVASDATDDDAEG